ncbi:Arc family DNA-binding protein [Pseudomonas fulva]
MKRNHQQFNIRLPEEIKQWIEEQARINCRSQTAEVIYWLTAEKRRQEQAATA